MAEPAALAKNSSGNTNEFGRLPEWNLDDLYPGPDSPELQTDTQRVGDLVQDFSSRYQGKLADLDGAGMLTCIRAFEEIDIIAGRIMSYAGLRYYQDTTDSGRAKLMGDLQARITDITAPLVFFSLEFNRIPDDVYQAVFTADDGPARYKPYFDRMRAMRPHQLSDELEQFLHDNSVVGAAAWNRLFDETTAALEFKVGDEKLGMEATLNLLTDHDRGRRESAARALARVFAVNIKLFARIHNTLTKEKAIEDKWRKMPTPQYSRHLANHVEPEVVEALRNAVTAAYPRLSHRYYALKAKWMGLDKLQVWDRNAPLPTDAPRTIGWDEARKTVTDAYAGFSPRLAELAEPFFEQGWIDAAVTPGKSPGAFAHPTVTTVHPYILLNYLGKPRDVMTLAHELGHGVHQRLAASQGELLAATPLTVAETASVFGEMLTFQSFLNKATDPVQKKALLAGKVEDMINTVVRQVAFYDFECKLHAARQKGELEPNDINDLWLETQTDALGPVFDYMPGYETFWAYIPHFVHSPFYVYAYAFGDGLVNALYAAYREGLPDFEEKYFNMLSAGGSKHHSELLAPFGLNASDPAFWDKGLSMIGDFIDQLEKLEE